MGVAGCQAGAGAAAAVHVPPQPLQPEQLPQRREQHFT